MKKILGFLVGCTSAISLTHAAGLFGATISYLGESLKVSVSEIRYMGYCNPAVTSGSTFDSMACNSFGGFMIARGVSNLGTTIPITLSGASDTMTCSASLGGFYWSAIHGDTLYPLDAQSKKVLTDNGKVPDLTVNGQILTACSGANVPRDEPTFYGQINYQLNGLDKFKLAVGKKVDIATNSDITTDRLVPNLQLVNDKYLVGFVYDSKAGVGFLGASINDPSVIDEISQISDNINTGSSIIKQITKIDDNEVEINNVSLPLGDGNQVGQLGSRFSARGTVSFSDANDGTTRNLATDILKSNSIVREGTGTGDVVVARSNVVNISDILNALRENSSKLCRGGWKKPTGSLSTIGSSDYDNYFDKNDIACIDATEASNYTITLNENLAKNGKNPILIVKNAVGRQPVKIIVAAKQNGSTNGHLTIFADNAVVGFSNILATDNIDYNSNYQTSSGANTFEGMYFKGSLFINGLIAGYNGSSLSSFPSRLVIEGSISSLNTVSIPRAQRVTQIQKLFNSQDNTYTSYIPMTADEGSGYSGAIYWYCVDGTKGSDNKPCKGDEKNILPSLAWYVKGTPGVKNALLEGLTLDK